MKTTPILFSKPMVLALLDDTKTQTRRVMKPQIKKVQLPSVDAAPQDIVYRGLAMECKTGWWLYPNAKAQILASCPYGQPGDKLRVKEAAWMWCARENNGTTKTGRQKWKYVPIPYAAPRFITEHPVKPTEPPIGLDSRGCVWKYKVGRFLPAWASRIYLEITAVRVERLQDISEADAYAEGVYDGDPCLCKPDDVIDFVRSCGNCGNRLVDLTGEYQRLWEQINGPGSWDANPWVWVVEFKRVAT